MVDLEKLDPSVQRALLESNESFKKELTVVVDDLVRKHGGKQLDTMELIQDIVAPMVGRANMNAKLFYLELLQSQKEK